MAANDNKTNTPRNADEGAASSGRLPASSSTSSNACDIPSTVRRRLADFPALAGLRLDHGDWHELSNQGFVCPESRGNLLFFKLRFRRGNQQVVRYIGDVGQAAAIRTELARLQAGCRLERELGRLAKCARRKLREGKRRLEPIVAAENLRFHGLSLRRPRKPKL